MIANRQQLLKLLAMNNYDIDLFLADYRTGMYAEVVQVEIG